MTNACDAVSMNALSRIEDAKLGSNGRRPLRVWQLEVVSKHDLGRRMMRVVFKGATSEFTYRRGQAMSFQMPLGDGQFGRRDFTIRDYGKADHELTVDFVLHRDTPSSNWVRAARRGDRIEAHGPRGRVVVNRSADWHLFSGDETCIPAIFHMLEDLDACSQAFAFIEIDGVEGELEFSSKADVKLEWCYRSGRLPGPSSNLSDRIMRFEWPLGAGQAYLIGETSNVRIQRHALIARGMPRARILAEGYWRPGRCGGNDLISGEDGRPR
jgi:NADPH-dependent ferric siderophore reductase